MIKIIVLIDMRNKFFDIGLIRMMIDFDRLVNKLLKIDRKFINFNFLKDSAKKIENSL
jgi:hypothetical protein